MKACKNCKHWRKIRADDYPAEKDMIWPGPHGECRAINHDSQDRLAWTAPEESFTDDASLVTGDDESLITRPDFYCAHFELQNLSV